MGWTSFAAFRWAAGRVSALTAALAVPGLAFAALISVVAPEAAIAADGQPAAWFLGLQPAASPVATEMHNFHDLLMWIITLITLFVLVLLVYVVWRFRASANPVPSRTSHNTLIEVLWTVVPILILIVIAVPSFKLLYFADKTAKAELTVKAIGKQW